METKTEAYTEALRASIVPRWAATGLFSSVGHIERWLNALIEGAELYRWTPPSNYKSHAGTRLVEQTEEYIAAAKTFRYTPAVDASAVASVVSTKSDPKPEPKISHAEKVFEIAGNVLKNERHHRSFTNAHLLNIGKTFDGAIPEVEAARKALAASEAAMAAMFEAVERARHAAAQTSICVAVRASVETGSTGLITELQGVDDV